MSQPSPKRATPRQATEVLGQVTELARDLGAGSRSGCYSVRKYRRLVNSSPAAPIVGFRDHKPFTLAALRSVLAGSARPAL